MISSRDIRRNWTKHENWIPRLAYFTRSVKTRRPIRLVNSYCYWTMRKKRPPPPPPPPPPPHDMEKAWSSFHLVVFNRCSRRGTTGAHPGIVLLFSVWCYVWKMRLCVCVCNFICLKGICLSESINLTIRLITITNCRRYSLRMIYIVCKGRCWNAVRYIANASFFVDENSIHIKFAIFIIF